MLFWEMGVKEDPSVIERMQMEVPGCLLSSSPFQEREATRN